jgi:hypothetical protein
MVRTIKTQKLATVGAATAVFAVLLAMSGALAPVFATTQQSASTSSISSANTATPTGATTSSAIPTLSVGQVITFTSAQGRYYVVGDKAENGTASGTVAVTVTGKFAGGYSVSITSGSLSVNGTGYAITAGSAEIGPHAHRMVGQGTTTTVATSAGGATSGAFLMRATAHGSFAGEYGTMSLDLQSGATEYVIFLAGSIQG